MKKKPLALWIFAGLALGIAAGMLLMGRPDIAETVSYTHLTLHRKELRGKGQPHRHG